ncbi:MAG: XRE family transcriptional regulator [Actinobacteria bacterium]|nr:XRE family transcriptional regulator [Actinomycetota bacterium]
MLQKRINLKVGIIENEITQQEFAKRLGLTGHYISDVIVGLSNMGEIKQIEASRILGIPREILFKQI